METASGRREVFARTLGITLIERLTLKIRLSTDTQAFQLFSLGFHAVGTKLLQMLAFVKY